MRANRGFGLLVVTLSLGASLSLAACGDEDSSEDEDAIVEAIEFSATSGDPAACTEAQTQAFTEQITGETGPDAVEQCEKDSDDSSDSVEVSNIESDDESATADIALSGGFFDSQTLSVALVKDGDEWKADELIGFPDGFDLDAFSAAFEGFAEEDGAPTGATDCVTENLAALSDEEIEDLFVNSDPQLDEQVFAPCFGDG